MANFTYIKQTDNLIASATLTPTTEDSSYPVENAQAEPIAKAYRTTSAAAQKILIDYAAPVTADVFAIVNHTLTSSATITLRGGSSQDPDGLDFELVIDWATRNAWATFAAEEWRYWSITIDDSTNPDSAFDVGLFVMGAKTELSRNFNLGSARRRETLNQVLESEYGVVTVGDNLYQRSRFLASWKATSAAERAELDQFLLQLEKERKGMFFIPDPAETEAFYGRLVVDHAILRTSPDIAEVSGLEFLEDTTGRSLFS